eukprot:TRINITY_DN2001_c0_g1_i4.p2 TRINITY_DN2001_c0_g1~~TRINITY_DN2001_c0_g1_i4.p2  ORF type:complete len:441 (-),score=79.57 TRINITY_DN2001_c0_g1_i4:712-2034(-)
MMRATVSSRQLEHESVHSEPVLIHPNPTQGVKSRRSLSFSLFSRGGKSGNKSAFVCPPRSVIAQAVVQTPESTVPLPAVDQALVVTGDIGGTNCRLQLWGVDVQKNGASMSKELFNKVFLVEDYPTKDGFEKVLESMLKEQVFQQYQVQAACFAVAGPVVDGAVEFTNSPWVISSENIGKRFNWQVALLNDFEAVGYGVAELGPDDVVNLRPEVAPQERAPMVVLGPGTGLGEAQLMWDSGMNKYKVWPSEGSHADFAPRGWKQQKLLEFCEIELLSANENGGHCEVEHVACGSGLARIYRFLKSDGSFPRTLFGNIVDNSATNEALLAIDPADISIAAAKGTDPFAEQAMDMFMSIIGQEAGHMALRAMAYGGVYIAGGIIPKNMERATMGSITEGFLNSSSRFNKVLQKFPLYLVVREEVGIIGTREYALSLLRDRMA